MITEDFGKSNAGRFAKMEPGGMGCAAKIRKVMGGFRPSQIYGRDGWFTGVLRHLHKT